jgi:ABC-type uncharacterized transport system permease subunit
MIEWLATSLKSRWRLERKTDYSNSRRNLFKILAIISAILITGIYLWLAGESPLDLGWRVIRSTLGTSFGLQQLLILATPLILTGLSMSLGGRMMVWNMGMEGQLYFGAWAATGVGLFVKGPEWLVLLLMLIAACIAAGLFAFIPAWLLVKAGISEIMSTILLNYVAVQWVILFAGKIWRDTSSLNGSAFVTFPVPYMLPELNGKIHIGIMIAVILVIIFSVVMQKSIWGYEVQSIGANKKAARFAGIPVNRHILVMLILAGAISGVAGFIELAGVAHSLSASISNFYGWDGMLVSMLAGNSFLAIIPYGLFMALILNGGTILQTRGLSYSIVQALIGLILLLSCVGDVAANYRIVKISPIPFKPITPGTEPEETSYIDKRAGNFSEKSKGSVRRIDNKDQGA